MSKVDEHRNAVITTLTKIKLLCIEAESFEEVDEIGGLIERTKTASLEEITKILMEAMVYNTLAKNSYIERNKKPK